jgi:meso-butanediol dehydrogenase / (S,S)-butanediol dehydrogenase / diacetyl reductase
VTPSVLITGGGTGIGAAAAERMAADGYAVCVAGRRREPLESVAERVGGLAVVADSGDPGDARRAVEACVERFGRLDALVVSAGAGASGTVGEQTLERWNRVMQTNLTGAFLICQAALPQVVATRGAIVTVASLAWRRRRPRRSRGSRRRRPRT